MSHTVEFEFPVRVRVEDGCIVGESARIAWSTEPKPTPSRRGLQGRGTIMHLRQRGRIAEGIRDMAKDFVEGHFRDTQV